MCWWAGEVNERCQVVGCACGGREYADVAHDTGLRMGTAEYPIKLFVSTLVPDPPGWYFVDEASFRR